MAFVLRWTVDAPTRRAVLDYGYTHGRGGTSRRGGEPVLPPPGRYPCQSPSLTDNGEGIQFTGASQECSLF
jgi:hypothetical protein